jgi:xylulokinase
LWGEILASVLNKPLTYRKGAEVGPAFGAARLAKVAITKLPPSSVCKASEIDFIIKPNSLMQDYYPMQHKKFQQLYQSLQTHF